MTRRTGCCAGPTVNPGCIRKHSPRRAGNLDPEKRRWPISAPPSRGTTMNSRLCCGWLSCVCVILGGGPTPAAQGPAAKVPEVPVVRPVVREVTDHEVFTGRTETPNRIDVRARVTGYLLKATFQEGADVKQ